MYVHSDFTSNLSFISNRIVEKIGPLCYLFLYNGGDDSFPPSGLRCYEDSEINYHINETIACDSLTPEITDIGLIKNNPFEVYFNNTIISITGIKDNTEIFLINNLGQSILHRTVKDDTEINIENTLRGNYILLLKTGNNIYSHKIYFL